MRTCEWCTSWLAGKPDGKSTIGGVQAHEAVPGMCFTFSSQLQRSQNIKLCSRLHFLSLGEGAAAQKAASLLRRGTAPQCRNGVREAAPVAAAAKHAALDKLAVGPGPAWLNAKRKLDTRSGSNITAQVLPMSKLRVGGAF